MKKRNSQISKNQETKAQTPKAKYDDIFLGADLHAHWIVATRIIDNSSPQPAQRFSWDAFCSFVEKQKALGKKIHVAYEAGAFGFGLCRKLRAMGINCIVAKPCKLDPFNKHTQNDKLDSTAIADNLMRYVRGNNRAMISIYVPTLEQEQKRIQARYRRNLANQMHRSMARGRGLLLYQGISAPNNWWTDKSWTEISPNLCPELKDALENDRFLIAHSQAQLKKVEKKLKDSAPKQLPTGMGALTFVLLLRELCTFKRFGNRRAIGGFTGLCGGVSASGNYHLDLSINKVGNPEVRALAVELAWRTIRYQPGYKAVKQWHKISGGLSAHSRRRKIATVALARQLLVDLWRWQTGLVTPQQLGWQMINIR